MMTVELKKSHLMVAFVLTVAGATVAGLAKKNLPSVTAELPYQACLPYSMVDAMPDLSGLPETCKHIFTVPGEVVRLKFEADEAWIANVPPPIPRYSLMRLYQSIIQSKPELQQELPDFNTWWRHLPIGDAP
jgi:hypothetical protein